MVAEVTTTVAVAPQVTEIFIGNRFLVSFFPHSQRNESFRFGQHRFQATLVSSIPAGSFSFPDPAFQKVPRTKAKFRSFFLSKKHKHGRGVTHSDPTWGVNVYSMEQDVSLAASEAWQTALHSSGFPKIS